MARLAASENHLLLFFGNLNDRDGEKNNEESRSNRRKYNQIKRPIFVNDYIIIYVPVTVTVHFLISCSAQQLTFFNSIMSSILANEDRIRLDHAYIVLTDGLERLNQINNTLCFTFSPSTSTMVCR